MMICKFCNSTLHNTAPAGSLKELYLVYICNGCQPHEVIYRELYNQQTLTLLAKVIRIDDYYIMINYQKNKTSFNKDTIINLGDDLNPKLRTYHKQVYELSDIWEIPLTNIETVKQKLQLYTTFS